MKKLEKRDYYVPFTGILLVILGIVGLLIDLGFLSTKISLWHIGFIFLGSSILMNKAFC